MSLVNFAGGVFGGFFGVLFPWEKTGGLNPPKSTANSHQNLGVLWPKSTLQGSWLEEELFSEPEMCHKTFLGKRIGGAVRVRV